MVFTITILDLYTRYAWAIPLKDKTGITITNVFQKIFKEYNRKPTKLWVDRGTEYYNKVFKNFLLENNITLYSTNNESKANMCERLNRTLKTIMWKKFTMNGNQKWVKILPEVLKEYNNKIPSVIKTTPKEASENPKTLENIIRENNFKNEHNDHFTQLLTNKKKKPKFLRRK